MVLQKTEKNPIPNVIVNKTDSKSLKKAFPRIYSMTSRDFHSDPNARLDLVRSHLCDKVTMKVFEETIRFNRHLFHEKVVLVLNCGTDLLFTLWACKYGAAHVFAVDVSQGIEYLKNLVSFHKLNDRVTILKGDTKNIDLPCEHVDVIMCNWMGYSLYIDSKIESVLYARDKWLKKGTGVIFPDKALFYMAAVQNYENKNERVNYWHSVYGFNMKALRKCSLAEPKFQQVNPNEVLSKPVHIATINLNKATSSDLKIRAPFSFQILRSGVMEGMVTFFEVQFTKSHVPMVLSTSPCMPYTNWLQTIFYFDKAISVNTGTKFYCGLVMNKSNCQDGSPATDIYMELLTGDENLSLVDDDLSLVLKMQWVSKWQPTLTHQTTSVTKKTDENKPAEIKSNTKKVSSKKSKIDCSFHGINVPQPIVKKTYQQVVKSSPSNQMSNNNNKNVLIKQSVPPLASKKNQKKKNSKFDVDVKK